MTLCPLGNYGRRHVMIGGNAVKKGRPKTVELNRNGSERVFRTIKGDSENGPSPVCDHSADRSTVGVKETVNENEREKCENPINR